ISTGVNSRFQSNPPARRDAHPKAHGCVKAEFHVNDTLPDYLKQGVFVPGKDYKAWIRFSNGDPNPDREDIKGDARGMAIKLVGVPGDKILEQEKSEETQDFIMINYPQFFINNPESYVKLEETVNSSSILSFLKLPLILGVKGSLVAKAIT